MRTAPALALLVAMTLCAVVYAGDEPHANAFSVQCLSCHATHKAAGQELTNAISNESVCTSCHNLAGAASRYPNERLYKADLTGRLGASHAWNVGATNAGAGAGVPSNPQMAVRLTNANVVCSTCHNQHTNLPASVGARTAGSQNQSTPVRIAGSGTGTVSYTAASNAAARGYLLEIVEAGGSAGTAKFRLSNDGGLTWFGWSGSGWVPYVTGNAQLTGPAVLLNDGANVTAAFSGNFVIGDRIRFYVGYPFLRAALDSGNNATGSRFCRDCHSAWAMDHAAVGTYDGSWKSHPVGVALNANGGGYDRGIPLDGNGAVQGQPGSDANGTNDLRLASDATVQCFTCHGVHHADGNTNTVDDP